MLNGAPTFLLQEPEISVQRTIDRRCEQAAWKVLGRLKSLQPPSGSSAHRSKGDYDGLSRGRLAVTSVKVRVPTWGRRALGFRGRGQRPQGGSWREPPSPPAAPHHHLPPSSLTPLAPSDRPLCPTHAGATAAQPGAPAHTHSLPERSHAPPTTSGPATRR